MTACLRDPTPLPLPEKIFNNINNLGADRYAWNWLLVRQTLFRLVIVHYRKHNTKLKSSIILSNLRPLYNFRLIAPRFYLSYSRPLGLYDALLYILGISWHYYGLTHP